MSVDEVTAKIGNPEVISSPSLKLSECSGDCNNISIMTEVTLANPDSSDMTDSRPVPGSVALPNHTGSTGNCTQSGDIREKVRGNENHVNRRNSFHHFKQQQKLTKRRSTSNYGFKHPSSGKRRRRANSESDSVLPTNFLLGGNIFDPLNLNSLLDEEVNKALNAETPKSSPLPAKNRDPVEILIPRDITDPLNLNSGIADSRFLVSAFKAGGRKRHRNRHHGGGAGAGAGAGGGAIAAAAVAAHLDHSELGKSGEARATQTPGAPASSALSDVPREPTTGDSHEPMGANAPVCREELLAPATAQARKTDDLTSPTSGRRRRRRNSGKTESPAAQSTPVAVKPGLGDRLCAVGVARAPPHPQAFHTPRGGARSGPWGRQSQHSNQQKHQQRQKFQYGNYNKYYGYRNPGASEDPRVRVLRPDWFQGKDVLDLGCNSGHLTLYIAKVLMPAHILGLDIDGDLVHAARKNIRHYLSEIQTQESRRATQEDKGPKREPGIREEAKSPSDVHNGDEGPAGGSGGIPAEAVGDTVPCNPGDKGEELEEKEMELGHSQVSPAVHPVSGVPFPVSLKISRGPIAAPPLTETASVHAGEFPSNVSFIKANYVLESDALLLTQRPEYDVITCLSVTKWVHLNWGDAGLKRLFQRVYRHLRPGGLFLLEPQPWESYVRRKKLTDNITKHFHSIRLKPDQFSTYLTNEVGFSSYEFVGTPFSSIRGFQRPIYLFHK